MIGHDADRGQKCNDLSLGIIGQGLIKDTSSGGLILSSKGSHKDVTCEVRRMLDCTSIQSSGITMMSQHNKNLTVWLSLIPILEA